MNTLTVQSEAQAISRDMRALYEQFKSGGIEREDADTLANISGKNLKAIAIMYADNIYQDGLRQKALKQLNIEQAELVE
jgi:hypothetical protein